MKKPKKKSELLRPTAEENDRINAAIVADPDTRELTEKDFRNMHPASEVVPEIVDAYRRSRGKQKAPTKVPVSIRLSESVINAYRQGGPGWQGRIDTDLQEIVATRKLNKSPRRRGPG